LGKLFFAFALLPADNFYGKDKSQDKAKKKNIGKSDVHYE